MKFNLKKLTVTIAGIMALNASALDVGGVKLGVGPKLGLNMNKAEIGNVGGSNFGFGWTAGAYSMLDLDFLAFELGVQYSQRRFGFDDLAGLSGDFAATLSQIEIPVLAYYKHSLGDIYALRVGAGAQFEFAMGKVKGDAGSVSYADAGISKNGTSILFDVGGDYKVEGLGTITADLRYALGLKDRGETSGQVFSDEFKTQYFELAAGLLF